MAADADKKGLPKVVECIFVSSKTKYNIRALCNLLYRTAFDIRTVGGKERLLEQKVPASYLAFEKVKKRNLTKVKRHFLAELHKLLKIVVGLSDEKRLANVEPVMKGNEFRAIVQERMRKSYGRAFRDEVEFNHACTFLHENGKYIQKRCFFLYFNLLFNGFSQLLIVRIFRCFASL